MQIPTKGFKIEDVGDGRALLLADSFSAHLIKQLDVTISQITELWALWREDPGDLSLLSCFAALERLHIINRTNARLDKIEALKDLKVLTIESNQAVSLNVNSWPLLEELAARWDGPILNLERAAKLKRLRIFSWRGHDLYSLDLPPHLLRLELYGGPLHTLSGIERCAFLEELSLIDLRKLADFSTIGTLKSLRLVRIDTCRKLESLDPIASLPNLEVLHIDNVGEIHSLEPLRANRKLRKLYFIESTNIKDGNTAIVNEMAIRDFGFQNRKHYNYNYNHLLPKTSPIVRPN